MRAGQLDKLIDIERRTVSVSAGGDQVETWAPVVRRRAAAVVPLAGEERFSDPQLVAKQQCEFRIRWSDSVASVSPLDRIVYPAGASSAAAENVYDVLTVAELGRREGLAIRAVRRADGGVTP